MPNASHPYTLASHTSQNLPKSMAAPTHRLTVDRKHGHTTSGIKHWGLSGCASILPRIKFGVTGQDNNPQSPTISYRQPLPTRRSRHAAKELQIANTRAIAKICNTFALADPQMKID